MSRISVAWISCWVRLARISGQASASVARSSVRHAPRTSSLESLAASIAGPYPPAVTPKRFGRSGQAPLATRYIFTRPKMNFVGAIWKLLVGIKDALVLLLLIIFFAGLYGALSARPAPVKDGV